MNALLTRFLCVSVVGLALSCAGAPRGGSVLSGASASLPGPLEGWTVIGAKGNPPHCWGHSQHEWVVSLDGGTLVVTDGSPESEQRTLRLPGGTLHGTNRGEWGGQLVWSSGEGQPAQVLLEENVVALHSTDDGFVAFLGLAHGTSDEGRIAKFERREGMWVIAASWDLGSAPIATASLTDGTVLFVTNSWVGRLQGEHLIKDHDFDYWTLYPNSIVQLSDGTTLIGMRQVVARLNRKPTTRHEWLLPPDEPLCPGGRFD